MIRSARARAFSLLENDGIPSRLRRSCDALFTLAIFAWLAECVFRTVPTFGRDVLGTFGWLELSIGLLFACEWGLRLWIAPEQYHEGAMTATNARLLQPRAMPKDSVVIRKGEPAHGMYFVLSGELEVHVPGRTVRLGQGSYFGEMALLSDRPRSATIVANVDWELLELGSAEFKRVCAEYPLLKERVEAEAARRLAASAQS